ncbi:MAG: histidine--tRNA ligase [bacterium]|nr:histidine--tRNA ligase [bacterium]
MPPPKPTKKIPPPFVKPARPVTATPPVVAPAAVPEEPPRIPVVQLLRGMKDIIPTEQPYWAHVRSLVEELARTYGYQRIDTPILEDATLFTRAVGRASDIVEKEMFAFTDQGADHVCLRPEGTASIVRAYVEHGMLNQPQPIKLWYLGPMFRYDRPQSGRLRQFHQFGLEILGEQHPATDAELIMIGVNLFQALAIPVSVQVNSIGCAVCRPAYEVELETYLRGHRTDLCEDCKRRMQRGAFLRVFDCTLEECRRIQEGAPQIVDWLCEACKKHFIRVLEYLDELEVPYALSSFLVRGLDYYTKTVFEFWPAAAAEGGTSPTAQVALAAGGRYDALTEALGGRPTPATGIAFGIERIILKMKEAISAGRLLAPAVPSTAIYLAQLGDQAKRKAMKLFEQLRRGGFSVAANFAKDSLKQQLEHANRLGVRLTLILGQKEVIDGTIIIREMSSGIQEIVSYEKVLTETRRRLEQETVRESRTEAIAAPAESAVPPEAPAPPPPRGAEEPPLDNDAFLEG